MRNPRQNIPQILLVVNSKVCAGLKPREIFDPPRRTGLATAAEEEGALHLVRVSHPRCVRPGHFSLPAVVGEPGESGEGGACGAPRLTVYTSGEETEMVKGIIKKQVMAISRATQRYRGATSKCWTGKDLTF